MRAVLRSRTVIAARNEINKSLIAQILKLLTYRRLDVLVTGIGADEIGKRTIVRKGRNLRIAAVRAIDPGAYPSFRPSAGILRAVWRLGFFEAEFHADLLYR